MTTKIEQTVRDNYLRLKDDIAETSIRCGRELSEISASISGEIPASPKD